MSAEKPMVPTPENDEGINEGKVREVKIIKKMPQSTTKNPEKESEIYNAWHDEGISSLMEIATEYENKIMRWFEEHKDEKIDEEQRSNIKSYEEASDAVNKKIEEVYGKMEGVEIKDTEVVIAVKEF